MERLAGMLLKKGLGSGEAKVVEEGSMPHCGHRVNKFS